MPLIGILLAVVVGLVIVALVVRDLTQLRLSRLRTQAVALRNEEQRIADQRRKVDQLISQASEAMLRGLDRIRDARNGCEELGAQLERLESVPEEGEEQEEQQPRREITKRENDPFA